MAGLRLSRSVRWIAGLVVLAATGVAAVSLTGGGPPPVATAEVVKGDFVEVVEVRGDIRPFRSVVVTAPYQAGLAIEPATAKERRQPARHVSRPNFIELCQKVTAEDEKAFEALFRRIGLSVDWTLLYETIGERAQAPKHDRERRQSEIGLGLAAARREKQQVDGLTLGI